MRFRDLGPRTNTALLFIHGQIVGGTVWDPFLPTFSDRRCITVDLPGHGDSRNDPVVDFERIYEVVEAGLAQRGVEKVSVVGYSLGTYLAFGLAHRGHLAIEALALLSPIAGFDAATQQAYSGLATGLEAKTIDLTQLGLATLCAPGFFDRHPAEKELTAGYLRSANVPGMISELRLLASHPPDFGGSLGRITPRTLLRAGQLDTYAPVALAEEMSRQLPNAKLEVVPGVAHFLPVEDLEGTRASLKSFFG